MTDVPAPQVEGYDPEGLPFDPTAMDAVTSHLGLRLTRLSPDRVEATMVADERHQQPYGLVHGGIYCTIVETLASAGAALRSYQADGRPVVGISNSTDFIRSHRRGRLDAVAVPVHVGSRQHLWEVEILREDGALVARGHVRLQVLDVDPDPAGRPGPVLP